MKILESGIILSTNENSTLRHLLADPEQTIRQEITEKAAGRKTALVSEWRPVLFADESVTSIPGTDNEIADLIFARSDYQTRLETDTAAGNPTDQLSTAKYNRVNRAGSTVTLFLGGIEIDDRDGNCILAYVQDIDDWVLGCLMGHIGRGKKRLIRTWHPLLIADETVTSLPATEAEFITTVIARADYKPAG